MTAKIEIAYNNMKSGSSCEMKSRSSCEVKNSLIFHITEIIVMLQHLRKVGAIL